MPDHFQIKKVPDHFLEYFFLVDIDCYFIFFWVRIVCYLVELENLLE